MTQDWLPALLNSLTDAGPPLCVGYSGGADSSSLLHALASSAAMRRRGLRAIHVDHGLDPQSSSWAVAAQAFCASLAIRCELKRVSINRSAGQGLEAAAREARYQAFAEALQPGEYLLLAQHRDDQAETVLLKLLRGAGPDALRGMRPRRRLGQGILLRPLLDLPGQALRDYAAAHQLPVQLDPSNQDTQLARNYLRHAIMPQLQAYWPQAVDSILHAARWCGEAADTLEPMISTQLTALTDPENHSLAAEAWLALAPALRVPILHEWLRRQQLAVPSTAQRLQVERQIGAQLGRVPEIRWPGTVLHIWRQRLWARPPCPPADPQWSQCWHGEMLQLPDGSQYGLSHGSQRLPPLELRLRRGGERIQLAGESIHRELRDLFQQTGLPPWQRANCPMVYEAGQLIAAGDRWLSARAKALFEDHGGLPQWHRQIGIDSRDRLG